jgi:hypothetical protein
MTELLVVSARDFGLRAEEVIREFIERPQMLLRLTVVGPFFPHRDSEPFVRIVGGRSAAQSLMAEVSPDQKELRGYFPTDVRLAGQVEFGYASQVLGRIPIRRLKAAKLDMRRVDRKVHRVTQRDLGPFKPRR